MGTYMSYYYANSTNLMRCVTSAPTDSSVQLYSKVWVEADQTVYHTVTFIDGHTGNQIGDPVIVEDGQAATAPAAPNHENDHYFFTGWNMDFSEVTSDLTVTALYEYRRDGYYTVTFKDWNGRIIQVNGQDTQEVQQGHAAQAPANPSRDGYTFTGWDKDFGDVQSNLVVKATYSKTVSKSYTVTLRAVYGPKESVKKTHVNWYANNDTYDCMKSEEVTINANINIQTKDTYVEADEGKLVFGGYTFLGWARMPEYSKMAATDRDFTEDKSVAEDANLGYRITQYNDLDEDDLWLVYNGADAEHNKPYFTVRENNQLLNEGAAFSHIAANENNPYHGLYAVWKRDVFYVVHSSTGVMEAVGMPNESTQFYGTQITVDGETTTVTKVDGTYDLTKLVQPGYLYGGYYKVYGDVKAADVNSVAGSFTANTATATSTGSWTAAKKATVAYGPDTVAVCDLNVAIDGGFTEYDVSHLFTNGTDKPYKVTGKDENGNPIYERDEDDKVKMYPRVWTASDAETANGTRLSPVAGNVYYLKEVPESYLTSRMVWTVDLAVGEENALKPIKDIYYLSVTDDNNYQKDKTGFITGSGSAQQLNGTGVTPTVTPFTSMTSKFVLVQKGNPKYTGSNANVETPIDPTYFGTGMHGYVMLLAKRNATENDKQAFTMIPAWTTPDGVTVTNDPVYYTPCQSTTKKYNSNGTENGTYSIKAFTWARTYDGKETFFVDAAGGKKMDDNNTPWDTKDGAEIRIRFNDGSNWSDYVVMTKTDKDLNNHMYMAVVPAGTWQYVQICRFAPEGHENAGQRWTATAKIPIPNGSTKSPRACISQNCVYSFYPYNEDPDGNTVNKDFSFGVYPKTSNNN